MLTPEGIASACVVLIVLGVLRRLLQLVDHLNGGGRS